MGTTRVLPLLREQRELEKSEEEEDLHKPMRADTFGDGYKLTIHVAARLLEAKAFEIHLNGYGENLANVINSMEDETQGSTPLHIASERGILEIVNLLLAQGAVASLDKHGPWGWTPLHLAVRLDDAELRRAVVDSLLEAGADT